MSALEQAIDSALAEKNQQREHEGKEPLQSYYRDFALLQEVTKAACNMICGDLTVAHTSADISPFSVTSFYQVGLDLGLDLNLALDLGSNTNLDLNLKFKLSFSLKLSLTLSLSHDWD